MSIDHAPAATAPTPETTDVIDQLAGIEHDERLRALRRQRPDAARHIQGSYRELFEPADHGGVSRIERHLAALRVALLTGDRALVAHHTEWLQELGAAADVISGVVRYPNGPALAPRIAAITEFSDLLTDRPGDASRAAVARLQDAGLSPRDTVTVAQLIAFVNFEVRLLSGLRLLGEQR